MKQELREWLEARVSLFKLAIEAATLLILLIYASLMYTEWRAVERSNAINKINAAAAQSAAATAAASLENTAKSFKLEQRAYLWPSSFSLSSDEDCETYGSLRICANVRIVNSGRTPALGVHLTCYALATHDATNAAGVVKAMTVPAYRVPVGSMFGSIGDMWKNCSLQGMDERTAKEINDNKVMVYIFGVVQYFDLFNEYHETGFCSVRQPGRRPFTSCNYGNWFDTKPAPEPEEGKQQYPEADAPEQ